MKSMWALLFLSLNTLAADYTCRAAWVKLELRYEQEMSTLLIKDIQSGEFHYNGVVSEIITRDGISDLIFHTGPHALLQLQFKSADLKQEKDKLFGLVRGSYGAGFLDQSFQCFKMIR